MSLLPEISTSELATLSGKTIIITGGASGIGRATAIIAHGKNFHATIHRETI